MKPRFISFEEVAAYLRGKSVAIIGSAPSVLDNEPGFVDSFDAVCRVNNYRTSARAGFRCDIHYAFYGTSIKNTADELKRDGVKLCLCKLPNSKPIESAWHEQRKKPHGIDYRYIYANRAAWWFTDTFIPDDARFLRKFELLDKHQPTTGFAAILDVLDCEPKSLFLTGFDGFTSGLHNVDEPHREKNLDDPIRHRPDLEMRWLAENMSRYPITLDRKLSEIIDGLRVAA